MTPTCCFSSQSKPDNVTSMKSDGLWESRQGQGLRLCTICAFNGQPVVYMKGYCTIAKVSWVYYPENSGREIIYMGFKDMNIVIKDKTWNMVERISRGRDSFSQPSLKDSNLLYLTGRQEWTFNSENNRECGGYQTSINLTISSCELGTEFTCNNGLCISIQKRCNAVNDCDDKSDEHDCNQYKLTSSYNKYTPPVHTIANEVEKITNVNVAFDILSINSILLDQNKIDLSYSITFYWVENRISYFNIVNNDTNMNDLPTSTMSEIWNPLGVLHHKRANIGSVVRDTSSLRLSVNVDNFPDEINPELSFEDYVYKGERGVLHQSISLTSVYECKFDIFRYPFDKQLCTIKLYFNGNHGTRILTNSTFNHVTFSGNQLLTEFEATGWHFYSAEINGLMEFGFALRFKHLYLKQLTQLYFQIILLWIVSYLTLFMDLEDFSNRFMGALTSLLVLTSLMDNINNRLPASPSIRLIDIWNIWYVCQIVLIILFHILFNRTLSTRVFKFNHGSWKNIQPKKLNNAAKVLFPAANFGFTCYYVVHNVMYIEQN